jgi:hypothetical protein
MLAGCLVLATLIACVGCIGGDDDPDSDPFGAPPTATVALQEAAENAVQDSLLTIDDLPAGWTVDSDNSSEEAGEALTGEFEDELATCGGLEADDDFAGQIAHAESPDFRASDGAQGTDVETYVFDSEEHAQEALDASAKLFNDCGEELERLFSEGVRQGILTADPEATDVQVTSSLSEDNTLKLGDTSRNFHIDVRFERAPLSGEANADFMLIRQGRMVGQIFYFSVERGSERGRITTAFSDKLYRAKLRLPLAD